MSKLGERSGLAAEEQVEQGSAARSIAVIGAGAAGMSAAWQLMQAGHAITLFERRDKAGGRMRTDHLDDIGFDAAVQLLGSNYSKLFSLVSALGVCDRLVPTPGHDAVWRRGRAHALTYGSVTSMITSSALPVGLKLKLGARYLPFLARHSRLDLHDLAHSGGLALDAESIGAWGTRELGVDFIELLAYPLLGAYYGTVPEETSAAIYHALARVGMDVSLFAARDGMGMLAVDLAEALAARGAGLRFDTTIERIEPVSRGVVVYRSAAAERYDAVVLAVPAMEASRLMNRLGPAHWLAGVRSAPTCTLALSLDRPSPANFFGLSLPRDSGRSAAVAVCVQERKVTGLVPAGRGALVVMPTPEQSVELSKQSPAEVLDRMLPTVEQVMPGTRNAVLRARVTVFPEGNPVFYPGYLHHLQTFDAEQLPRGIELAGDYLVAPTVEGAVRSGLAAANRLVQRFKSE